MKKNVIFSVIAVLLVIVVGISFAYFTSGFNVTGDGSDVTATPGDFMKVVYDAGSEELNTEGMVPGDIASKKFSVTISPTANEKEATYAIILNINTNTFVKCDDSNYDIAMNACIKDEEELIYRLKNESDQVIAEGTLMGVTGELKLITETKTVEVETTYQYTLEIEFVETNADQNHNANKVLNGNVEVEISEPVLLNDAILANSKMGEGTPDFSKTSCSAGTNNGGDCEEETIGLYAGTENGEPIYYFRGDVDDNWVSFAGFYWRIIRTNSDGSIRMIYAGTDPNVTTGEGTQISLDGSTTNYQFNSNYNRSEYVGLKYTENEQHGTAIDSDIMGILNTWYTNNLASYASQLTSGTGFCNDRNIASGYSWSAIPSSTIYYAAFERLFTNKMPSLDCDVTSDNFTTSGTGTGNGALTNPIGLITADEVSMAGGKNTSNYGYYLFTGLNYWTMSPYYFNASNNFAHMIAVFAGGQLTNTYVSYTTLGIRPVINLRSDVTILSGDGTSSNPYVVEA